jgi:UPF0755 protein
MRDIIPPRKPNPRPVQRERTPANDLATKPAVAQDKVVPTTPTAGGLNVSRKSRKPLRILLLAVLIFVVATLAGGYMWYQNQLLAVSPGSAQRVKVVIEQGMGPKEIGDTLDKNGLLKNRTAYDVYIRGTGASNLLQAGYYTLGPHMSLPEIVKHLTSGRADTFRLTFFPGATLRDTTDTPRSKKTDVKNVLLNAGYEDADIEAALNKKYDHPLFASKPESAGIEGYIYGETYEFTSSATPEEILIKTFDQMYKVVQENSLVSAYKKQDLSLYEGITLASIVQREVPSSSDQKDVAGVFYNRLEDGTMLGSDVTYQYIADKTGVPRDPGLDSPYNTRKYAGLPPGPIASPGESALLAVAQPTDSDFFFFLSGDDDVTYFGKTQAEHETNIERHCQEKCKIL